MKGGIVIIHCSRCPARLAAGCTVAEFARALEERGWRMLTGGSRRAVLCPECAKKEQPENLVPPRRARVAT